MTNHQAETMKRYTSLICQLAARAEQLGMPYKDLMYRKLTKSEWASVLKFINEHTVYAEPDTWENTDIGPSQ